MNIITLFALALLQASPASLDSVRQAFQSKNYADVIKLAGQVLPSISKSGTAADKSELLEMKGEAHLQMKQWPQAAEAYTQAGALSTDEKLAAVDRATGTLIKRSAGGKYSPKQPSTNPATPGKLAPMDILDETQRKAAFSALYIDDSKLLSAKSASLEKATALPALMQGLKQVSETRYLEMAATGSDTQYRSATSGIIDHASKLMTEALTKMESQVATISQQANTSTQQQVPGQNMGTVLIATKRGLYSPDRNVLNDIINTTAQVAQACGEFGKAAGKTSAFDAAEKQATALNKRATEVLNADYSTNVTSNNPPTVITNPGTVITPTPTRPQR